MMNCNMEKLEVNEWVQINPDGSNLPDIEDYSKIYELGLHTEKGIVSVNKPLHAYDFRNANTSKRISHFRVIEPESKVKTAEIIAEELWDKYSEYIDDDIMSLDSVAGSSVIKSRRLFLKAVVEASSIFEARNNELEEALRDLVNLSGIYEPAKGSSKEGDQVIKAIESAEQVLNKK